MADPGAVSPEGVAVAEPPPAPGAPPTPLQGFTSSLGLLPEYRAAGAREAGALRESAQRGRGELAELRSMTDQQDIERKAAIPKTPTLPTPPDTSARPFLAPPKGMLDQLQTAMTGLTQMVVGAGGLRGNGHAIAAVAALKGGVEGWMAGDHERAKNALTDWHTQAEKAQGDYMNKLEAYRNLLTDQKRGFTERLAEIGIRARIDGDEALALSAERQNLGEIIQVLSKRETESNHFGLQIATLQNSIKTHDENFAETKRNHDLVDARTRELAAQRADDVKTRNQDRLELSLMKGGPWIDGRTGKIVDNLTRSEWNESGGHQNFKPISKQQQVSIDVLQAEAIPQIDQLQRLGQKILAKYPGQNLAALMQNYAKGKLSDSDVREYGQARNAVTFTLSRALGGSSAVRKFIFDSLDHAETPTAGDTQQTMMRMSENSRMAVVNFIRSAKGWEPFALPSTARTVEGINQKGEIAKIKLAPYEPLPDGWQYRY